MSSESQKKRQRYTPESAAPLPDGHGLCGHTAVEAAAVDNPRNKLITTRKGAYSGFFVEAAHGSSFISSTSFLAFILLHCPFCFFRCFELPKRRAFLLFRTMYHVGPGRRESLGRKGGGDRLLLADKGTCGRRYGGVVVHATFLFFLHFF